MERPEVSNIWNNPGEIMIDDNVDPEKNKDEIDLSDDDDECFAPKQPTPETETPATTEPAKEDSGDESDDGAPQARPFTLPFLPMPTKPDNDVVVETKEEEKKTVAQEPVAEVQSEETKSVTTKGGFKRRNQAIYTKEEDDDDTA